MKLRITRALLLIGSGFSGFAQENATSEGNYRFRTPDKI
jgi:hypothetical protein